MVSCIALVHASEFNANESAQGSSTDSGAHERCECHGLGSLQTGASALCSEKARIPRSRDLHWIHCDLVLLEGQKLGKNWCSAVLCVQHFISFCLEPDVRISGASGHADAGLDSR